MRLQCLTHCISFWSANFLSLCLAAGHMCAHLIAILWDENWRHLHISVCICILPLRISLWIIDSMLNTQDRAVWFPLHFNLLTIVLIKHFYPRQQGLLYLYFHITVHYWGKSTGNSSRAGLWRQELKQKPRFTCTNLLSLLSHTIQIHLSRGGPAPSELTFPYESLIRKMPYRPINRQGDKVFSQFRVLFSDNSSLFQVNKNPSRTGSYIVFPL